MRVRSLRFHWFSLKEDEEELEWEVGALQLLYEQAEGGLQLPPHPAGPHYQLVSPLYLAQHQAARAKQRELEALTESYNAGRYQGLNTNIDVF